MVVYTPGTSVGAMTVYIPIISITSVTSVTLDPDMNCIVIVVY